MVAAAVADSLMANGTQSCSDESIADAVRTLASMRSAVASIAADSNEAFGTTLTSIANDLCCHLTLRVHFAAAACVAAAGVATAGGASSPRTPRGGVKLHTDRALRQARWCAVVATQLLLQAPMRALVSNTGKWHVSAFV